MPFPGAGKGYRVEKATSEERSLLAEVFKPLGMIF